MEHRPRSEKEKMLAGELYLATDPELVAERRRARRLLAQYNASDCDDPAARWAILDQLLGALGERIEIEPPFYCDYGTNIFAGDNLYMNFGCVALDCNRITLGQNIFCGPYVQLYTAYHPLDPRKRAEGTGTRRSAYHRLGRVARRRCDRLPRRDHRRTA